MQENKILDKFFKRMIRDTRVDSTHVDEIGAIINLSPEEYRKLIFRYLPDIRLGDYLYGIRPWKNLMVGHYNPFLKCITVDFSGNRIKNDSRGAYHVFFHEVGHAIDDALCRFGSVSDYELRDSLRWDAINLFKNELAEEGIIGQESEKILRGLFSKRSSGASSDVLIRRLGATEYYFRLDSKGRGKLCSRTIKGSSHNMLLKEYATVSDIIGGLTNNKIGGYGFAHRPKFSWLRGSRNELELSVRKYLYCYWYNLIGLPTGRQNREFFAEMFAHNILGNKNVLEMNEMLFPESSKLFYQIIKKAVDKK